MNGNKLKETVKNLSIEDKVIVFIPFVFVLFGGLIGFILALLVSFINFKIVKKFRRDKKNKYIFSLLSFLMASFLFGILLSITQTFLQEFIKA